MYLIREVYTWEAKIMFYQNYASSTDSIWTPRLMNYYGINIFSVQIKQKSQAKIALWAISIQTNNFIGPPIYVQKMKQILENAHAQTHFDHLTIWFHCIRIWSNLCLPALNILFHITSVVLLFSQYQVNRLQDKL